MAYFLFLLRLLEPPLESKSAASRVAGFLEARNAETRRYLADTDIWISSSFVTSFPRSLFIFPLLLELTSLLTSADDQDGMLTTTFSEAAKCGCRQSNNFRFMPSSGTRPRSFSGSQYLLNNGLNAIASSSTLLVILENGFKTTLIHAALFSIK